MDLADREYCVDEGSRVSLAATSRRLCPLKGAMPNERIQKS